MLARSRSALPDGDFFRKLGVCTFQGQCRPVGKIILGAQGFKQLAFGNIFLLDKDVANAAAFFFPEALGFGQIVFSQAIVVDKYLR